jgi:hypothetical protein
VLCFAENIPEGIQYLKTHLKRIEASYNRWWNARKVGLLDKEEAPNSELDFVAASIKP